MYKLWTVLLVAAMWGVQAEIGNSKGSQPGPLCWGPGIWPHPESCRLFTICQLRYEVRGQLFICPENTGFSTKHLRCIAEVLVPNCLKMSSLNANFDSSSAIRIEPETTETTANACDSVATPYCRNDDVLVLCGPNRKYMGVVNCASQKEGVYGRCDADSRSCVLEQSYLRTPSTTTVPTPTSTTTTPYADDADNMIESKSGEDDSQSLSIEMTPDPHLPASDDIVCLTPGLQCYDNVTIIDCPADLSEPNFVMSCANIIVTSDRNASGYCNAENPACVMLVEGFKMSLEIAIFDFGDEKDDPRLALDELDDEYNEPELYDSDLLRESSGPFDGLSWFRAENKSRPERRSPIASSEEAGYKVPQPILIPAGNGEALSHLLSTCKQGSLFCYDNATLLACSGDLESPTYAVVCAGEAVLESGELIEMYCDVKTHSCLVAFDEDRTTTEEETTTETTTTTTTTGEDETTTIFSEER